MPSQENYEDVEIDINEIDFSDLEEKYAVTAENGFENFIVIDGAPIAPESKADKLTAVLKKLFAASGKLVDGEDGFYMPIEDGKTKGYIFVQYETKEMAETAIKNLNGKKLDQKHRLFANKLSDIEKYGGEGKVEDEFSAPVLPPFEEGEYLKSWLQDESGRDQFVLQYGDVTGVFWNKKAQNPEKTCEPRAGWSSRNTKWSPSGTYIFSIHPQGIQSWGGASFERIRKFAHPEVRLFDFSPCEKYLITLSPVPISVPPEDHEARAACPFGEESEGHKLVIWEISTGLPVRTFALPQELENQRQMPWPLVKWSFDGKYCARKGPDAIAVYETSTFSLVDKKTVKIEGVVDFEWSPAGVHLATTKKSDVGEHILAYWTPESTNQTARVAVMQIPSKQIIRTVNVFQVSDCKFHWQDEGKYLCVKVDRHTKSKKTFFTNLEFFKLQEKDIPVEKMELKDTVFNFAWEPKSERFITISRLDTGNPNPAFARNTISFYAPEIQQKGKLTTSSYQLVKSFENKFSNGIYWSPKGRFAVISTIYGQHREMEFYDIAYEGDIKESKQNIDANVKLLASQEFYGLTDLQWDPSGRFVAVWSSFWTHEIENGFKLFDFTGKLLYEEAMDRFKGFDWRPRPASLLSAADRKKVRKNLREYSAQFDESDAMEADAATREAILLRRRLLEEWRSYRSEVKANLNGALGHDDDSKVKEEVIEEIKEEIIEEKEEIIE